MPKELLYISCKLSFTCLAIMKANKKKIVRGYMNEGVEICGHLFAKSAR